MGFNATEIIAILCKLADSEGLRVTANEHSKFNVEDILKANHWSKQLKELHNFVLQSKTDFIDCGNGGNDPSLTTLITNYDNNTTSLQRISTSLFGLLFTGLQAIFSRTWNYFFGNYQMSVNVRVAPVSSVLRALPPTDQNTLALRIRRIIEQNSITTYEALAAEIEQDSSLVRRIILKYLVEYMDEDLSMTVTRGI